MKERLPNLLSYSRMLGGFLIAFCLGSGYFYSALLLTIIFVATDYFDGHLARKYNVSSTYGAKIDPVADKLLILIVSGFLYYYSFIPWWLILILYLRNISQLLAFPVIYQYLGIKFGVKPKFYSKLATSVSFAVLIGSQVLIFGIPWQVLQLFLYICFAYELFIFFDYLRQSWRIIQRKIDYYY